MKLNQLLRSRGVFTAGALAATGGITYMNKERMPKYLNVSQMMPKYHNVSFMNFQPAECWFGGKSETKSAKKTDVDFCREDLAALVRAKNCGPILIRLSWHDSGTYQAADGSGGPRACMRFAGGESDHGANAGLQIARDLLSDIKAKYPKMSNADFWSLSAVVAIKEMGGPDIPWRAGRSDSSSHKDSVEDGRLPDATQGCPHLRSVFHRMGLTDQEIVVLSGAHAVGSCHADRSGFIGPWTADPLTFSNAYFVNLVKMKWSKASQKDGKTVYKTDSDKNIIMLPSDIALLTDEKMVPWVELYAADEKRFFADFAVAFAKLQELGVKSFHTGKPYDY